MKKSGTGGAPLCFSSSGKGREDRSLTGTPNRQVGVTYLKNGAKSMKFLGNVTFAKRRILLFTRVPVRDRTLEAKIRDKAKGMAWVSRPRGTATTALMTDGKIGEVLRSGT